MTHVLTANNTQTDEQSQQPQHSTPADRHFLRTRWWRHFSSLRYRCQTTGKFVVTGTCWHQTRSANRCLRARLRCRPGTQRCRALLSSRRQLYRTISDVTTTTRQCVIILTASSWFHRRRVVAWQLRVNSDCGRLDVARSASLVATAVAAAAIAAADCEAF